jgi:hypothetical protein
MADDKPRKQLTRPLFIQPHSPPRTTLSTSQSPIPSPPQLALPPPFQRCALSFISSPPLLRPRQPRSLYPSHRLHQSRLHCHGWQPVAMLNFCRERLREQTTRQDRAVLEAGLAIMGDLRPPSIHTAAPLLRLHEHNHRDHEAEDQTRLESGTKPLSLLPLRPTTTCRLASVA